MYGLLIARSELSDDVYTCFYKKLAFKKPGVKIVWIRNFHNRNQFDMQRQNS